MSITDAARRMAELAAHAADEKSASNIAVIDVSDVLAITELLDRKSTRLNSSHPK